MYEAILTFITLAYESTARDQARPRNVLHSSSFWHISNLDTYARRVITVVCLMLTLEPIDCQFLLPNTHMYVLFNARTFNYGAQVLLSSMLDVLVIVRNHTKSKYRSVL